MSIAKWFLMHVCYIINVLMTKHGMHIRSRLATHSYPRRNESAGAAENECEIRLAVYAFYLWTYLQKNPLCGIAINKVIRMCIYLCESYKRNMNMGKLYCLYAIETFTISSEGLGTHCCNCCCIFRNNNIFHLIL